jgi:hypothetical protein
MSPEIPRKLTVAALGRGPHDRAAAYDGFPDREIVNSIVFVAGAVASFRRNAKSRVEFAATADTQVAKHMANREETG